MKGGYIQVLLTQAMRTPLEEAPWVVGGPPQAHRVLTDLPIVCSHQVRLQ